MSYYYKYNFISPESIFAIIKEEFKSYYDTGAIDDLLFPTYVDKCLRKLGRSSYVISEEMLYIEDFQARLPDNFVAVREAWLCIEMDDVTHQTANSFYSQTSSTTIQIAPLTIGGKPCGNPLCQDPNCTGTCLPEILQAVYKTNHQSTRSFRKQQLLKPGNISARKHCDVNYMNDWEKQSHVHETNPHGSDALTFDVRDNKFVVNFRNNAVYLIFYSTEYDDVQNQMIPDNYRIKEYIEAFIKFKMFETLTNQTNDETFNQLQQKMVYYKQLSDETFILANTEIMKKTVNEKQMQIKQTLNRFNMYELPNRTNRHGLGRRNN